MRLFLLLAVILLPACQTVKGDFCDIAKPNRPTPAEIAVMSDERVEEQLAHNEKGERLCGWRVE